MKKKFGELLLERGLITPEQLADGLALQRRRGMRLGAALLARGHITESQLIQTLGTALNLRVVEIHATRVSPEAIKMVGDRFARTHELFPFDVRKERGRTVLSVAMSDPLNFRVIDELSFITNAQIEPVLARGSDIDSAILRYYGSRAGGTDVFGRDPLGGERRGPKDDEGTMTILRKGGHEEVVDTATGEVLSSLKRGRDGLLENAPVSLPPSRPGEKSEKDISAVLLTEEVVEPHPLSLGTGPSLPGAPSMPPLRPEPVSSIPPLGRDYYHPSGAPSFATGDRLDEPAHSGMPPALGVEPLSSRSFDARLNAVTAPHAASAPPSLPAVAAGRPPQPESNAHYFDDALGALLDAAGGAVNAEAFLRLERKFWALMRVLAKKGVLTNADFLNELSDEDR